MNLKLLPILKSNRYRDYIKSQCCLICDSRFDISPHHHKHTGGLKPRDQLLIPLCLKHHNEFHFNESSFAEKYCGDKKGMERLFEVSCITTLTKFLALIGLERDLLWVIGKEFPTLTK